jgi:hypothetical protein
MEAVSWDDDRFASHRHGVIWRLPCFRLPRHAVVFRLRMAIAVRAWSLRRGCCVWVG